MWALIVLALFLAALIGVIVLARSIRPWLAARRAASRAGHGRILAAATWTTATTRPDKRPPGPIVALGPDAVCRTLDHISKDPGDGQQFGSCPARSVHWPAWATEAVPGLCEGLRWPEPKVRDVAVEVLQQMGAAGRGARDRLLATLDDENDRVRYDID